MARQESIAVACELEANPTDIQFTWRFNNSDNRALTVDLPQNQYTNEGVVSVATYTPMTEQDYGTLQCRGSNSIGVQSVPCVFYVVPAGKNDNQIFVKERMMLHLHYELVRYQPWLSV